MSAVVRILECQGVNRPYSGVIGCYHNVVIPENGLAIPFPLHCTDIKKLFQSRGMQVPLHIRNVCDDCNKKVSFMAEMRKTDPSFHYD